MFGSGGDGWGLTTVAVGGEARVVSSGGGGWWDGSGWVLMGW